MTANKKERWGEGALDRHCETWGEQGVKEGSQRGQRGEEGSKGRPQATCVASRSYTWDEGVLGATRMVEGGAQGGARVAYLAFVMPLGNKFPQNFCMSKKGSAEKVRFRPVL
eukprot:2014442-Pyramimonas_sp.AAC.1